MGGADVIGAALEGGGARGAYHVGVLGAYREAGVEFGGFAGTSIGSINAALMAQGDYEKLRAMWLSLTPEKLFAEPVARLLEIGQHSLGGDFLANLEQSRKDIRRGVDTSRMKALIGTILDEPKLRASGNAFALVTVCLSDLKPMQLHLEDIPEGELLHYLMASASFPGFRPEEIDGKKYLDGGLYNNCPVNLLLDKGFDQVIAIRTLAPGVFWPIPEGVDVTVITPSRDLGNIMSFDPALIERNMNIGYFDALRVIRGLAGHHYFIEPFEEIDFGQLMMRVDDDALGQAGGGFLLPELPRRRLLFERILPELGAYLRLGKDYHYEKLGLALLENAAQALEVESLRLIDIKTLAAEILQRGANEADHKRREWHERFPFVRSYANRHQTAIHHIGVALARVLAGER